MSASGSEVARVEEHLRRKAIANRSQAENRAQEDDNIVIKMSEWKAMAEIISDVFTEIQGVTNRMYLLSKKDPDIKRRRDIISGKANTLWTMLTEQRTRRANRTVSHDKTTIAPKRSDEEKTKRKVISPLEREIDSKLKRARSGEVSYAAVCADGGSTKAIPYYTDSDGREEWIVVHGRKEKKEDQPWNRE